MFLVKGRRSLILIRITLITVYGAGTRLHARNTWSLEAEKILYGLQALPAQLATQGCHSVEIAA